MINLGTLVTKMLPKPYFAELYTFPFYFSRFDLGVLPVIGRAGITVNPANKAQVYAAYRRTQDSRSGTIEGAIIQNSIPQIFEDNAAIYSLGFRFNPFKKLPLLAFIEAGQAEDLIYRNRPKWRGDLRGGLVYFKAWGQRPSYTSGVEFPMKWVSTLYADLIYYSRFDNNVIGTMFFRPGIRAMNYQTSTLDFYLANYLILDKNHEFFNNVYYIGPGMALRPTQHLNVVLRLESLQGYYIPVNSPTPNPYRSKFYNNVAMVEAFYQF